MVEHKYFMHRIRHDSTIEGASGWDKGIEIHDTYESAKQAYHAYLGAYAYAKTPATEKYDFVFCGITDTFGSDRFLLRENWVKPDSEFANSESEAV